MRVQFFFFYSWIDLFLYFISHAMSVELHVTPTFLTPSTSLSATKQFYPIVYITRTRQFIYNIKCHLNINRVFYLLCFFSSIISFYQSLSISVWHKTFPYSRCGINIETKFFLLYMYLYSKISADFLHSCLFHSVFFLIAILCGKKQVHGRAIQFDLN